MQEKTVWPTTRIVFLGILVKGDVHMLGLPLEERLKALNLLNFLMSKRKVTVKQIQNLTGLLNFLNRAIFPGRAFKRRMYAKISMKEYNNFKLQGHHHINLDSERLQSLEGIFGTVRFHTDFCRPFVDLKETIEAEKLNFFSDASSRKNRGFSYIFDHEYAFGKWQTGFIQRYNPCIEYLAFYSLSKGLFV